MTHEVEARVRAGIVSSGERLSALASQLGGGASGFELELMELGQVAVTMHVGAPDSEQNSVVFGVELWPGWSNLGPSSSIETPSWLVEAWIDADCLHVPAGDGMSLHTPARDGMETVYSHGAIKHAPVDAAEALRNETDALIALATSHSVDHWTDMTGG
jgi:hypothetical protein